MAEKASRVVGKSTKRIERRAFVRLTSELAAECRQAGHGQLVSWPGYVRDISRGGLGLVLRHRFRPGTCLTVELRQRAGAPLHVVRVRVVHVSAILDQGSHGW
ncbi:MAG TPA: PilZ domain-containing protein, partial [Gemmataceae bacterium]|nr:PilZ domain-containing protein [Gemmataceae bacterium]